MAGQNGQGAGTRAVTTAAAIKEIGFPWDLPNIFKTVRTQYSITATAQMVAKADNRRVSISFACPAATGCNLDTVSTVTNATGWFLAASNSLQVFSIRIFPTMVLGEFWCIQASSGVTLDVYEEIRMKP